MTVRLHIERLVLEGLDLTGAQAERLKAVMAEELGTLFASNEGAEWSSFAVPAVRPLEIAAGPRDGIDALAAPAAAALYRGLRP